MTSQQAFFLQGVDNTISDHIQEGAFNIEEKYQCDPTFTPGLLYLVGEKVYCIYCCLPRSATEVGVGEQALALNQV